MLKPLFANMLGKMGTGIEIFVFNNKDSSNNKIFNAMKSGGFKVNLSGESFDYQLPLISLLAEMTCAVDQQKLPGNYIFCPMHGNKL